MTAAASTGLAQLQELTAAVNTLSMQLAVLADHIETMDRRTAETQRDVAEISRELWIQRSQPQPKP